MKKDIRPWHERPRLHLETGREPAAATRTGASEVFRPVRAEPPFLVRRVRDPWILGVVRDHEVWELGMRERTRGGGAGDVEVYGVAGAVGGEDIVVCRLEAGLRLLGCGDIAIGVVGFGLPAVRSWIGRKRWRA